MIVTAEPYFAVSQPSDVVVMENVLRADTLGKADVIDAKYELSEARLVCVQTGPVSDDDPCRAIPVRRRSTCGKRATQFRLHVGRALTSMPAIRSPRQKLC